MGEGWCGSGSRTGPAASPGGTLGRLVLVLVRQVSATTLVLHTNFRVSILNLFM